MIAEKLDLRNREQVTRLILYALKETKAWNSFHSYGTTIALPGASEEQVVDAFQKIGYVHVATDGYSLANQGSLMCLPDRRFPISIPRYGAYNVTVVGSVLPQFPKILSEFELLSSPMLHIRQSITMEFKANVDKVPARYGEPEKSITGTTVRYDGCQYFTLSVHTVYQNFTLTMKED